MLFIVYINK